MATLLSNNNQFFAVKKQSATCLVIPITVIITVRKSKEWSRIPILQSRTPRFNPDLLCLFTIFVADLYFVHNLHIQKTSIRMLRKDRQKIKYFIEHPWTPHLYQPKSVTKTAADTPVLLLLLQTLLTKSFPLLGIAPRQLGCCRKNSVCRINLQWPVVTYNLKAVLYMKRGKKWTQRASFLERPKRRCRQR